MSARSESEPLRLTIIAATGGIGRQLLEQALAAGHRVTAVVRDPADLSRYLSAIAAAQSVRAPVPVAPVGGGTGHAGAVNHDASDYVLPAVCVAVTDLAAPDAELLEVAIEGADAVLSALGPRSSGEIGIAERGTWAIVQAMRAAGVRRLVAVSSAAVATLRPQSSDVFGTRDGDLDSMQDVLRASDLDWTIVRPPELTDDPLARRYRTADGANERGGLRVSHADVAHLMLRALGQPQTVRQTIGHRPLMPPEATHPQEARMAVATHPLTGTFEADRHHSSVVFGVRHLQVSTFRGSFADVEARLVGDASGLRLEGSARVDSISITDPPELREHVVRSSEFFDADAHPEIRIRSERVELARDGSARVEGELTMKGITRPLVATGRYEPPLQDPFGATRAALELRAVLDRRDWGFAWQMPLPDGRDGLGWTVEVTAQLELVKTG